VRQEKAGEGVGSEIGKVDEKRKRLNEGERDKRE
jgi:hypothetical protein